MVATTAPALGRIDGSHGRCRRLADGQPCAKKATHLLGICDGRVRRNFQPRLFVRERGFFIVGAARVAGLFVTRLQP